ncbi:hypothetical protein B296_00023521 [Ensete ventricosum]|uniref:Uncharacterized protein n=1 Tax=Ensete ventricosum TaxID=4639 RepID=A0A426Z883_ENSVE|nr:hypothetical protein B296_00023521 [Ensete ventricosum]
MLGKLSFPATTDLPVAPSWPFVPSHGPISAVGVSATLPSDSRREKQTSTSAVARVNTCRSLWRSCMSVRGIGCDLSLVVAAWPAYMHLRSDLEPYRLDLHLR